ncbi:class I SAM-dependent DNA methyltransferase [Salibacterium halotolerans]|uniref:Methyltransferase domain-containing protein n=1 Tax=Salibacterium halotolerans TaxID=1884432 RepID=A0A1I5S1L0_9BACI|nr:class I SAM-dependent methyltransferase [Salibacterium halotolerans]SFP64603.1 Methyltransferase domain-containing protein [Salibacterium halotolerans]
MDENIFDEMAERFDTPEQIELSEIIGEEIKKKLPDAGSKDLLEYGAGTGLVGLQLSGNVRSVQLVDSSEPMLNMAREKISRRSLSNVHVQHADFTKETPELEADVIVMSLVLHHIHDAAGLLRQLFHVLRQGGRLLIVDFDKDETMDHHDHIHKTLSHDELTALLTETGFSSTDIRTFHHGKGIFNEQDASLFLADSVKE